jgi:cell division protein ZapA
MNQPTVLVNILDKDYHFACPPEERAALIEAARILNEMMKEIRRSGVGSFDRMAVMAALNLSHEALKNKTTAHNTVNNADIERLSLKIDACLKAYD